MPIEENMSDLIAAIHEVLALLKSCGTQPKYTAKFESCEERLSVNPADVKALHELSVLSAPKGFLGDGPLYPKPNEGMSQDEINMIRWRLVERIQELIKKEKA